MYSCHMTDYTDITYNNKPLTGQIFLYMYISHVFIPLVERYVVVVEFLTSVYQTGQAENST